MADGARLRPASLPLAAVPHAVLLPAATTLRALVAELTALLLPVHGGPDAQGSARGEARDLVAALLDVPRFWPTAHPEEVAEPAFRAAAVAAARRRLAGAPFAYAVGRAAFRHLTLDVDARVLIPRPETELLIDEVLALVGPVPGGLAIDVGTGSGAIALALAMEGRFDRVIATDISLDALAVAAANRIRLGHALQAHVELRHGALLAPVHGERARLVVSNPPYIATGEACQLPRAVRDWEPALALYSGASGMDATRQLVHEAAHVLEAGGVLALEVDARRASLAAELVATHGAYREVAVRLDLAGRERFVLARRDG